MTLGCDAPCLFVGRLCDHIKSLEMQTSSERGLQIHQAMSLLTKQMLKTWGYISHWDYILIQPSVRGAGQIHNFIDIKTWPLALEYIMSLCFMSSVLHLKTTCYYCSYVVLLSIRISLIAKISLSHASIMTGGAILCLGEGRESTIRIPFSICVVTCG